MSFHQTWQNVVRLGGGPADGSALTIANASANGGSAPSRMNASDIGSANGNVFQKVVVSGQHRWRQTQALASAKNQVFVADAATRGIWSIAWEFVYRTPSASGPILRVFADTTYNGGTTTVNGIDFNITTTGKMYIRDSVAAVNSGNSTGQMVDGQAYSGVFSYDFSTNLAAVTMFNWAAGTVALTQNFTIATDIGIGSWDFGLIGNGMMTTLDTLSITAGWGDATGELAPRQDLANEAPTATATASDLYPQEKVAITLQGGGGDTDGSIATRQWTAVSWPDGQSDPTSLLLSPNNAACSFTPPAQGRWAFAFTNTDDDGATSTPATVTIYCHVDPTAASPLNRTTVHAEDATPSAWTVTGPSVVAALNSPSSSQYIESPGNPSGYAYKRVILNPMPVGAATFYVVGYAYTSVVHSVVRLLAGATVVDEWTYDPAVGAGQIGTPTLSLDAAGQAAVPDGDLAARRGLIMEIGTSI